MSATDVAGVGEPEPSWARGLPGWVLARLAGRVPGEAVLKVLTALAVNPRQLSYASTAHAAQVAGVNVASVVRAGQLLGYDGWPGLRADVRSRYLAGLSAAQVLDEHGDAAASPSGAAVQRDLRNLQDLAAVLDDEQIRRVAGLVQRAGTTLVLGSGSFAAPGLQLAHIAATVGYDARLHRDGGTSLLNAASLLRPGDCLVLFRLWRSPREMMSAARVAADGGASVVVVSDRGTQEIRDVADEVVLVPSEGASMFPSLTAAVSVVHAVLAELIHLDEEHATAASDRAEALWGELGLFPTSHDEV